MGMRSLPMLRGFAEKAQGCERFGDSYRTVATVDATNHAGCR